MACPAVPRPAPGPLVIAATMVFELVGPVAASVSLERAGEAHRSVGG